jgi:uncharacterized membrane protein HdeD (DUF308 family)
MILVIEFKLKRRTNMNPFVKFMASRNGRITRIVAGAVLILLGFFVVENTTTGIILMVVGLVPLLAGIFDYCLLAPLFGVPMSGAKIRAGK